MRQVAKRISMSLCHTQWKKKGLKKTIAPSSRFTSFLVGRLGAHLCNIRVRNIHSSNSSSSRFTSVTQLPK